MLGRPELQCLVEEIPPPEFCSCGMLWCKCSADRVELVQQGEATPHMQVALIDMSLASSFAMQGRRTDGCASCCFCLLRLGVGAEGVLDLADGPVRVLQAAQLLAVPDQLFPLLAGAGA